MGLIQPHWDNVLRWRWISPNTLVNCSDKIGEEHLDRSDSFNYDSVEEESTMKVKMVEIKDEKLMLSVGEREIHLPDGTYRSEDGTTLTVAGNMISDALILPDFQHASNQEIRTYISELQQQILAAGIAAQEIKNQYENFDQKANQLFNLLSTVMKGISEMQSAVVRNIL